jgi:hypothetical protein
MSNDSGQTTTETGQGDAAAAAAAAAASAATPAAAAAPAAAAGADGAKGDSKGASSDAKAYEAFTVPEGVAIDAEVLGEFEATAKEAGLSQEAAQKLVNLGAKLATKGYQSLEQQMQTLNTQWVEAARSDPEIGGKDIDAKLATAKKAWAEFGTPELKDALEKTGMGNNPELIRWAYRVGKALSEDRFVSGRQGDGAGAPKSLAARLYGGSKQAA